MDMDEMNAADPNAVSIVSDGTEEGTAVYIGGKKISGVISVRWELRPTSKKARVILEIDGATIDANQSESYEIRQAVRSVQQPGIPAPRHL